jgi:hypothetical protein
MKEFFIEEDKVNDEELGLGEFLVYGLRVVVWNDDTVEIEQETMDGTHSVHMTKAQWDELVVCIDSVLIPDEDEVDGEEEQEEQAGQDKPTSH